MQTGSHVRKKTPCLSHRQFQVIGHWLRAAATILVCTKHWDSRNEVYLDPFPGIPQQSIKILFTPFRLPRLPQLLHLTSGLISCKAVAVKPSCICRTSVTFCSRRRRHSWPQGTLAQRAYLGQASLICVVTIVFK